MGSLSGPKQGGAWCPSFLYPSDSCRSLVPPFGRDGSRIERGTLPLYLVGLPEAVQKDSVRPFPHACLMPFLQASPASHPDPQPISWSSISQGMPLFSTKTMPVRAARSLMRGLPPWGFGASGGRSGSIVSHSSSVTSSLAMFSCYPLHGFVRLTY